MSILEDLILYLCLLTSGYQPRALVALHHVAVFCGMQVVNSEYMGYLQSFALVALHHVAAMLCGMQVVNIWATCNHL